SVPAEALGAVRERFHAEHLKRFGFAAHSLQVIIEALRVEARCASVDAEALRMPRLAVGGALPPRVRAWFGAWRSVPLLAMRQLAGEVAGPALIVEPHSTLVLEEGWRVRALEDGELLLEDRGAPAPAGIAAADPARLEIFNNLFMHIAEQMGEVLKATAQS